MSCGTCHNNPYRDAGAGITISKNGGTGRNTPHLYGTGLIEMIGLQLRLQALAIADTNHDGWISFEEMKKAPRCVIRNLPVGVEGEGESVEIDFGSFDDLEGKGFPSLNPLFYPVFVDQHGNLAVLIGIHADTQVHFRRIGIGVERFVDAKNRVTRGHFNGGK